MSDAGKWLMRKFTVRRRAARLLGKKAALGKIRCTVDPSIFPIARIIPIVVR
jgi:hypothetical protein